MDKRKIFMIDDEQDLLDAYTIALKGVYEVIPFLSPLPAIAAIEQGTIPDVFITDIKMPEMNGIEFVGWLRKHHIESPVVIVSGNADKFHAIEALKLGASDLIEKPFQAEHFRSVVRRAAVLSIYQKLQQDLLVKYRGLSESLINLAQTYEARFLAAEDQLYRMNALSNMDKESVSQLLKATKQSSVLEKVVENAQSTIRELMSLDQDIRTLMDSR
jgi:DNA-binding NtrC family response regulator